MREEEAIRNAVGEELSRRQVLARAGALGAAALVVQALPVAARMATPGEALAADPGLVDGTLQAFWDTMIPGRPAALTDLGNPIHPQAIAGVDSDPGAVEADALLLGNNSKIGFATLAPAFLGDLEARSLARGGPFLGLDYSDREAVCISGLEYGNPTRVVWEAAAAVAFTAFCAAATQRDATWRTASGYRVMRHPGTAPRGYRSFSYRRRLARERTRRGYLP